MNLLKLQTLADKAKDLKWGSHNQIEAENAVCSFYELNVDGEQFEEFEKYCLKATTDEMMDYVINALTTDILDFEFKNDNHVFAYLHYLMAEDLQYHFDDDVFEIDWHAKVMSYGNKSTLYRNAMRLYEYCDIWAWFDKYPQMWEAWKENDLTVFTKDIETS